MSVNLFLDANDLAIAKFDGLLAMVILSFDLFFYAFPRFLIVNLIKSIFAFGNQVESTSACLSNCRQQRAIVHT